MRRPWFVRSLACLALFLSCVASEAAVRLPAVIGDGMVLQRGCPVPIWGWAAKGEEVTVTLADKTLTAKADDDGRWKVVFPKLEVGQPLEMTVRGSSGSLMTLKNILVGEVWVCSGQSNMEMGVGLCNNAKEEVANAKYPDIRLFMVPKVKAELPAKDVHATWKECSPKTIAADGWCGFSAAAYFFGRELHKELKVPVGLIDTSWGGTPAEYWTSRNALLANPTLKPLAEGEGMYVNSYLYNGMIAPLVPYAIRGAIWYQGETNVGGAYLYRTLFPAMIADWRAAWGQGDFPFLFAQIAPFPYAPNNPCPELWEAQLMTLKSVPNTGMAVTTDIGDVKDIHPKNKQEVGRRLALWALARSYNRPIVCSGPIYRSMAIEGNTIRLNFDHVGGGLAASDGKPLAEFTIAGADQKFVPATATIDGDTIVVRAEGVAKPVAVRFAWRDIAQPNLANKDGLPASPFRTDSWKGVTQHK